jgi:hypothetical protein
VQLPLTARRLPWWRAIAVGGGDDGGVGGSGGIGGIGGSGGSGGSAVILVDYSG